MRIQDLLTQVAKVYGIRLVYGMDVYGGTEDHQRITGCMLQQNTNYGTEAWCFSAFEFVNNRMKIRLKNALHQLNWNMHIPNEVFDIKNEIELFRAANFIYTQTHYFNSKNRAIIIALLLSTSPHSPYYLEHIPMQTDTAFASLISFFLSKNPDAGVNSPARNLPDVVGRDIARLVLPPHPLRDLLRLNNTPDRTQYTRFLQNWHQQVLADHPKLPALLTPAPQS